MGFVNDDNILLSLVNTYLRDGGDLEGFCANYGAEQGELFERLSAAGYEYDEVDRTFKRI